MFDCKYKAFISYSHKDEEWVRWLHRALESYRIPKYLVDGLQLPSNRLSPIFRDRDELASSNDLTAEIKAALNESENLIVVCSRSGAVSRWVNEEIVEFKKQGKEGHIFCVLVDDPAVSFPPAALRDVDGDGFATFQESEPLAADPRAQSDGKRGAILKLVAGMIGVGLDDLRRRDQQRRQRNLLAILTGSIVGMALTSTLALWAFLAQQEANSARKEAEAHRASANDLLSFMIGDLRVKLDEVGRLDILDDVGERALTYFSKLDKESLSPDERLLNAVTIRQIGQVRSSQGHLDAAVEAYKMSAVALRELHEEMPSNEEFTFELSQSEFYVGSVYYSRRELPEAQQKFHEYMRLVSMLSGAEPENEKYTLETAYAYANLAVVALAMGQLDQAASLMSEGVARMKRLVVEFSTNLLYRRELAESLSWLGELETRRGNPKEASDWEQQTIDEMRILVAMDRSPDHLSRYASHLAVYGQKRADLGDFSTAINFYDQAQEILSELTDHDPSNADWRFRLYTVIASSARAHYRLNKIETATALFERADKGFGDLVATRLKTEDSKLGELTAEVGLTQIDRTRTELAYKLGKITVSAKSGEALFDGYLLDGDLKAASGDLHAARGSWSSAQKVLTTLQDTADFGWKKRSSAELLHRIGKHDEELELVMELQSRGYWVEALH